MPGAGGEDIRDIDPREWSPSHGVEAHVDVQHGGHALRCGWRVDGSARDELRGRVGLEDSTNGEEQGAHANSRDEERQLTTETVCRKEDEESSGDNLRNKE